MKSCEKMKSCEVAREKIFKTSVRKENVRRLPSIPEN